MNTWVASVVAGMVSYVFRAAPLLVLGPVRNSDRVDRAVRHGGAAVLTALLVGALQHGDETGSGPWAGRRSCQSGAAAAWCTRRSRSWA